LNKQRCAQFGRPTKGRSDVPNVSKRLAAAICVAGILGGSAFAQSPTPKETPITPPRVVVDKAAAKQQAEQKQGAKKWSTCKRLRKEQKITVRQRGKFMTECMKS
jgi:hypothetical protein